MAVGIGLVRVNVGLGVLVITHFDYGSNKRADMKIVAGIAGTHADI